MARGPKRESGLGRAAPTETPPVEVAETSRGETPSGERRLARPGAGPGPAIALVKRSELLHRPATQTTPHNSDAGASPEAPSPHQRARERSRVRHQKVAERIAAATEELASGVSEAAAASNQLRKAMEQIASGAEESAGAAQQSLTAIAHISAALVQARINAESSRKKTEALQTILAESGAQISSSVASIATSAERQAASAATVAELEKQAANIGDVTRSVSRISGQTNLLALNAAIEAARAGDHGRGFAVVADEVRTLAETSEKSAQQIQNLTGRMQGEVKVIVEGISAAANRALADVKSGEKVSQTLDQIRQDMIVLAEESQAILIAAVEAESAAREAQKGSEEVAAASEEQSAAAVEALSSLQQQNAALAQSQRTAQNLATIADDLRNSSAVTSSAEEVASASEELSATIQELSSAATEIMGAIGQIDRGAQEQAAATQELSSAMGQIEKTARAARENSDRTLKKSTAMMVLLTQSRAAVAGLVSGVEQAVSDTRNSLTRIAALDGVNRQIDKIVDDIGMISIQTNMLAVSGSVEAARTGEFGRGFAVVSSDIRNLSRESADNAARIKETVRTIQDQISTVRRDLEQIMTGSEIELQKSKAITAALTLVEADMEAVKSGHEEIGRGAETILTAASQALAGARSIAAAAEETGSASAEAATAAREQAQGAEDLAAAIEEIASLADELQSGASR
jgi:methyl-accepting chemotaxis protein